MRNPVYQSFIAGRWTSGDSAKVTELINPATEQPCGEVTHANAADIDSALLAAQDGFARWGAISPAERARILCAAAEGFALSAKHVLEDFTRQQGKTLAEARGEMHRAYEMFRWTGEHAVDAFTRECPAPGVHRYVLSQPLGVVAAFTPWNYPAVLAVRKVVSALAAGCSVILKAAEEVPAPVVAMVEALADAGVPPNAVNLLLGDPAEISGRLLASPIVSKMSFTGSTRVGRHLAGLAARNLIRCTLELGGHAPVLIFDDANIEAAARAVAEYKFECAGQSCNAPSRVYVQAQAFDSFMAALVKVVSGIKVGDGRAEGVQMGPLQHIRRLQAVSSLVDDATAKGAEVILGGARIDRPGYFYAPTILTNVANDSQIFREEPFGPVLPIIPFSNVEEGIGLANDNSYGLAGYCFTSSPTLAKEVPARLHVGYVGVNRLSGVPADAPVGGVKASGYGLEGGMEGIQDYLHPKLVTEAAQ